MKLYVLFMQRKEDEGEFFPESVLAWDEYTRETNPKGFDLAVEHTKQAHAKRAAGFALVTLVVDGALIRDMCLDQDRVMKVTVERA